MSSENPERHVYHIGPWRYLWYLFLFGAIILFFFAKALFSPVPDERAGLIVGGIGFTVLLVFLTVLIRFARLEVSEKGVRLRQFGYRLEAPWSDIIRLRLNRGHEAFITSQPVGGKGAGLLAAAAGFSGSVVSLYDAEQLTLVEEHRLIPIEAFVWHLRHGKLRAQIERFAPHLRNDLAVLDAPPAPSAPREARPNLPRPPSRPWTLGQWVTLLLIAALIGTVLYIGMSSPGNGALVRQGAEALFQTCGAIYLAMGSRGFFRRGSWIFGSGMVLVSILLGLWAFATSGSIAEKLGAGPAFTEVFVILFFALLAVGMAYGARKAFRRRYRVLGVIFLFFALCLSLFTLVAVLNFAKAH